MSDAARGPSSTRRGVPPDVSLAIVMTVLFAALTVVIVGHVAAVQALDDRVHGWVVANRSAWSVSLAQVVTSAGSTTFVLPALFVVGAVSVRRGRPLRERWGAGLLLAAIGATGVYVGLAVNAWVGRPRPTVQDWEGLAGGPSYPSGHTTTATLFAVLCAWALTRRTAPGPARAGLWTAGAVVALAVGWTRVWLGVHWPSDVAGGLLLGVAWSAMCLGAVSRARSRRARAAAPAEPQPDADDGRDRRLTSLGGGRVSRHGADPATPPHRPR